jgi:glycosyltransferase involved in cell wall biosynthesis
VRPVRVGVVCDLREEGWHSMDLVADMLLEVLPAVADGNVHATRLSPAMVRRWTRLPVIGGAARAHLGDRLTSRLWDYPRWLARRAADFDAFHIVDQSYAHLVRVLPGERTIVTCHDLDAIQPALSDSVPPLAPPRVLAGHVLGGLKRAAHVACVSHATRSELLATGTVKAERVSVVHEGVHPSCSPAPHGSGVPPSEHPEVLHVGSTIARKRIDVLLEVFSGVRAQFPGARLLRVGGPMTSDQRALASKLGIADGLIEMPFLEREALAALYRRASVVVLPSDAEGFGLPIAEAMACGAPVVASAIPALMEIGGSAALYCAPGDATAWIDAVAGLLREQLDDPSARLARRQRSIANARRFSWTRYAAEMVKLYERCGVPVR